MDDLGIKYVTRRLKALLIWKILLKMKVTIFALVAALCVALVSANAVGFENLQPLDLEYVPETSADNVIDNETLCIFSSFFWIAKAALRTLKGANCTIKQVIATKSTAQNFIDSIKGCGTDATNAFKNVITSAQSVIETCNNIINLNEKVCNNDASTNGSTTTTWKCFLKLLSQMYTLNKQINNTLAAIKKVPSVPSNAVVCTNGAVNELTSFFTSFPSTIKTCSKLTT